MGDHDTGLPDLGDTVIYRSKTGNYDLAALVSAVKSMLWRPGVEAGYVPELDSDMHVHLAVLTPAIPGKVAPIPGGAGNINGIYPEWNIPFDPAGGPGTWRYI